MSYLNELNPTYNSHLSDVTFSSRIQEMLPAVKEILRKIKKESSEVVKVAESYSIYVESKINKSEKTNEQLMNILDMPLGRDGKRLSAKSNTDMVLNFSEMIQFETVDLIKNILDLVDLSYETLLQEVSKTEEEYADWKFRHFLKSSYIPRNEHEEILGNLEMELRSSLNLRENKKMKELEFLNEDLRRENARLKKLYEDKNEETKKISFYETQLNAIRISTERDSNSILHEKENLIQNLRTQLEENERNFKRRNLKEKEEFHKTFNQNEAEIMQLKTKNSALEEQIKLFEREKNTKTGDKVSLKKRIHELEVELLQIKKDSEFEIDKQKDFNRNLENKYRKEISLLEEEISQMKNENSLLKKSDEKFEIQFNLKKLQTENDELSKENSELKARNAFLQENSTNNSQAENSKLNEFYEGIIEGHKQNLEKEKQINRKNLEEKEEINYKYLKAFSENENLRKDFASLNSDNEKQFSYLRSELEEQRIFKDNLLIQIEDERKRCNELSAENSLLRKQKAEIELENLDLKEKSGKIPSTKLNEKDFNISLTNNNSNNSQHERNQIASLQQENKNLQMKLTSKTANFEKQISEFILQEKKTNKAKGEFIDRIGELEQEIFELRSNLISLENEEKSNKQKIEQMKIQLEKSKQENFELNKLKNSAPKVVEVSKAEDEKIKEDLKCRIEVLEGKINSEREKQNSTIPEYEQKLEKSQLVINEYLHEIESLKSQKEILSQNFENEKKTNGRKIQEQTELIEDLTRNRDKMLDEISQERNLNKENFLKIQKELQEYKTSKNSNGNNNNNSEGNLRIGELEYYLLEERNKNEKLKGENENLQNEIRSKILIIDNQNREILKSTSDLNNLRGERKQICFDYEITKSQLESKDAIIRDLLEEKKNAKIKDEKQIQDLQSKNKENLRRIEELTGNLNLKEDEEVVCAGNPEENNSEILMQLKAENAELTAINKTLEEEMYRYIEKIKQNQTENNNIKSELKDLKCLNEELRSENGEVRNYKTFYNQLKPDYDEKVSEIELMRSQYSDFDKTLKKEKEIRREIAEENDSLKRKINSLIDVNGNLENDLNEKNRKIGELEDEINSLKSQLLFKDEQINELNRIINEKSNNRNNYNEELMERIHLLEADSKKKQNKIKELNEEIEELSKKQVVVKEIVKMDSNEEIEKNLKFRNSNAGRVSVVLNPSKHRVPNSFYDEMRRSRYYLMDFDSNDYGLLVNRENWHLFKRWLEPLRENHGEILKLNLLYKATFHGFGHMQFKERARRVPNTLIVVKTNYNKVIGGFTPLKWDLPKMENHEYIYDKTGKTFLYSVDMEEKYKLMQKDFAICNASQMGPIFGAGSDLEIMDEPNRNKNNYGNIGKSFNYKGTPDDFYGNTFFYVVDYECYEVLL